MLLIDGVKYVEWTPPTEDELEQMVKEHAQGIFGENSIYLDIKHKLTSRAGVGSIPDGYVITFDKSAEWHIVEVELSSHQLYEHVVPQVSRFVAGIANPATRNQIVSTIYSEINGNDYLKIRLRQAIGSDEIYKFVSELIARSPCVTIVIEKKTPELDDAINAINCPEKKVVEFRTFRRQNAETVHAHLFEPIGQPRLKAQPQLTIPTEEKQKKESQTAGRVTFEELVTAGLLKDGEVLYFYNTRLFKDERATVVADQNKLRYESDGNMYSPSRLAEVLFDKYNFNYVALRGPNYWITEGGKLLVDLQEKVREKRGDRK